MYVQRYAAVRFRGIYFITKVSVIMDNSKKINVYNGITEGVIWKQILFFFFPILIGTFFQQLYNTVDAMVVGRFVGKEALSCVSASSAQILNLVVGFFVGLSSGAAVIISQYYGGRDRDGLDKALHTAYAFSLAGGLVAGIFGIIISKPLMVLMNTPDSLMDGSLVYLRIYFAGLIFVFIYNMGSGILRAIGDAKRPLHYLMICCTVNIVLDLTFVIVFNWGVAGVAVATLISQAMSAVLVTRALMYHTAGLKLEFHKICFHGYILRKITKIGFPTGIQSSMYCISNMVVQGALNVFGVNTMAAWGAYGKVDCIVWMINEAFGIAITTFAGQNFGAKKPDRIKKGVRITLVMSVCTLTVLSVCVQLAGTFLFGLFITDKEVINIGMKMVRMIAPAYEIFAFIEIFTGVLRAEGDVIVPTVMTLCGTCLFRIAWILWIVPGGTLEQIIICYPITWSLCALMFIGYYVWKQKRVYLQFSAHPNNP